MDVAGGLVSGAPSALKMGSAAASGTGDGHGGAGEVNVAGDVPGACGSCGAQAAVRAEGGVAGLAAGR